MSTLPVNRADAQTWARAWIAAWNARDIDAVLGFFVDNAEFRSPKAAAITGNGSVRGKPALEAYWCGALAQIGSLHFVFETADWDAEARALVIRYVAELNGQRLLAAEIFDLDETGRALRGTALYGAALS